MPGTLLFVFSGAVSGAFRPDWGCSPLWWWLRNETAPLKNKKKVGWLAVGL